MWWNTETGDGWWKDNTKKLTALQKKAAARKAARPGEKQAVRDKKLEDRYAANRAATAQRKAERLQLKREKDAAAKKIKDAAAAKKAAEKKAAQKGKRKNNATYQKATSGQKKLNQQQLRAAAARRANANKWKARWAGWKAYVIPHVQNPLDIQKIM